MNRPVLVVQHTAVCPPNRVGRWLSEAGCDWRAVRPYAGEPQPVDLSRFSGLVVLGGEMGAYDDEAAPWLPATRALLAQAVSEAVPTLAICLGHQLLAVACGGAVSRSPLGQQGGTVGVGLVPAAAADPLFSAVPVDAVATHWNNDIVTALPPGAVELARTPAGVQAMRLGDAAWGVQFHPEVDLDTAGSWAAADVSSGHLSPERARAWQASIEAADAAFAVARPGITFRT
ncbi:MAG: type 1 glutamine amidotransferase, partial [Microlunatus sp.]|nr:type 1 glutamine amidotransferase [Microlunatus sp.]